MTYKTYKQRKASRKAQERAREAQGGKRIVTVGQAFQRYYEDHGRYTIDPNRITVAWGIVGPRFRTELIGPNLYKRSAAYYQYRVGQGVAPSTVRREMTASLLAPLRHCYKLGLLPYIPPLYTVKQKPNHRIRILSDAEITRLIESAREWPWLFKTVVILAHTAQRIKAVVDLQWDQVDLVSRLINFNRPGQRLAERMKGRGKVPINDELFAYMVEWKRAANRYQHRVVGELPAAFYFHWRRMVKRSGLGTDVTPHIMRHSIATKLVREGKDIRLIQLLLGHKSVVTTEMIYVKNDPETIRTAVAGLSFTRK